MKRCYSCGRTCGVALIAAGAALLLIFLPLRAWAIVIGVALVAGGILLLREK